MTTRAAFLRAFTLALPLTFGSGAAHAADLVETAKQSGRFDILLRAIEAADLTGQLRGEGPFTVFAPTDDAFRKLPAGVLDRLLKEQNRERLRALLLDHVVAGKRLRSTEIPPRVEAMSGDTLSVTSSAGGPMLGSGEHAGGMSTLVGGDIEADNGVIHVVDALLVSERLAAELGMADVLAGLLPPPGPADTRAIPYAGPLEPGEPPPPAAPPFRELRDHDRQALSLLYKRPSEKGPAPIPASPAKAISAVGKGQVFRLLPGPEAFPEHVPHELKVATGDASPYSRNVVLLPGGEVRFASIDRTSNDTNLSGDWMAFEASFTDEEGNDWRIVQLATAPLSPDPIADPWYGGVAIDLPLHGMSKNSTPEHPLIDCAMCSWGWADVWKNGQKVGASALLHVMLSSEAHDPGAGYEYTCYDCRDRRMGEVHAVVTQANLPTPGGFLHVMWHESEFQRAEPAAMEANPPVRLPGYRTVTLDAVNHLQWSDTRIDLRVREPVRLVLNNMDPASFHGFVVRGPQGIVQVPLEQGSQWVTSLVFDQPGEYEFWCPVANHRDRGMYGRFVVAEGVPGGTEGPPGNGQGGAMQQQPKKP